MSRVHTSPVSEQHVHWSMQWIKELSLKISKSTDRSVYFSVDRSLIAQAGRRDDGLASEHVQSPVTDPILSTNCGFCVRALLRNDCSCKTASCPRCSSIFFSSATIRSVDAVVILTFVNGVL